MTKYQENFIHATFFIKKLLKIKMVTLLLGHPVPHNMTLFKFICVQYQFHRQTLPIMKIDRGQIQFRDYVSTGTEPKTMLWLSDPNVWRHNQNDYCPVW